MLADDMNRPAITRRNVLAAAAAAPLLRLPSGPRPGPAGAAGRLRRQLDTIVAQRVPGALAVARAAAGGGQATVVWAGAGVASLRSGRAPEPGDRFRIASITKTFVATVVLQLVAEGLFKLDDPVRRHLPGLLPYPDTIRVRHLLQHTSGLPDYHDYDGLDTAAAFIAHRYDDPSPRASVALATAHPLLFPPGSAWRYADTNYLVLGLLAEHVTGAPISAEVTRRLIVPLGLSATSFPRHTPLIHGEHLHGYMPRDLPGVPFGDAAHPVDFTRELVNLTGAAGAMISSGHDLLRFLHALLRGRLLPARLMREMTTTVPVDAAAAATGVTGYGLGLAKFDAGNGIPLWGNTGLVRGYTSALVATRDARRQLAVAATLNPLPGRAAATFVASVRAMARQVTAS